MYFVVSLVYFSYFGLLYQEKSGNPGLPTHLISFFFSFLLLFFFLSVFLSASDYPT
jgi:hypothetical protein